MALWKWIVLSGLIPALLTWQFGWGVGKWGAVVVLIIWAGIIRLSIDGTPSNLRDLFRKE